MKLKLDLGLGLLAAASIALSACSRKSEPNTAAAAADMELASELNAWIAVRSEPQSRYRALDVERAGKGEARIIVERKTPDGKRYDERLINCDRQTFTLEREAETKGGLEVKQRAIPAMIPWVAGTPDDKIARYACAVAPD